MTMITEDLDAPAPSPDRGLRPAKHSARVRVLDAVERLGNRFPDPVVLFLAVLLLTWIASRLLAGRTFGLTDPRSGAPLEINDQLTLSALAAFFAGMTQAFVSFPPLGLVLVMAIGVGVAERAGLVGAALRGVLATASRRLLTPLVAVAAIFAHVLSDSATVVVVPLAAALFYVAGRHPIAGVVAGFAPLFGVMFANFVPSGLDVILAGFSEAGASLLVPGYQVNPLSNHWVAIGTALAVVPATWWLVERVVEPRVSAIAVDGDPAVMPSAPTLTSRERTALWGALATMLALVGMLAWAASPSDSPFRAPDGSLTGPGSRLLQGLIPVMLVLTVLPSIAYGLVARTIRTPADVIEGMVNTMSSMGYYVVMVFFAALFTRAFAESNIGALIALKGADVLRTLGLPAAISIMGIVMLTALIDVVVPSASAKWALLAPIFVPMLLSVGIAPEFTQAAFRIGDGPVNMLTPLMPHFPLVLAFCRRYVTGFGIGTLMSLLLPFGIVYMALQTVVLLLWWMLGLPLGIEGKYVYP
jgi:aminobenzoyl-glutamate transport protein